MLLRLAPPPRVKSRGKRNELNLSVGIGDPPPADFSVLITATAASAEPDGVNAFSFFIRIDAVDDVLFFVAIFAVPIERS